MSDSISRQDAINTSLEFFVEFLGGAFHENAQKELIARFQRLLPAQPERKKGHWKLLKNGDAICSECGFVQVSAWDMDDWDNFCHHCGSYNGG